MKKMLKIAFSLLMTLVLAAGMCVSSVAGDAAINLTYKGEAGGGFEFKPGSGYTSTDLFDNFKNVMPGDELEQKVVFTNSDTQHDYVNLYMRAVPHGEENAPQAQVSAAESNEFLSKLEMWVYNGETEIYHASPDQPAQLASDVLLGSFFKGETATLTVKLKVPIELDNQYANRIGEVDWVFSLNRALRQCPHRFDEGKAALRDFAKGFTAYLLRADEETDESLDDLHTLFGAACALAELQQALPGEMNSTVPLRLVLDRRPFI